MLSLILPRCSSKSLLGSFKTIFFYFCLHSRFQFFWVPEDGATILKCPVSLQSRDAPRCSAVNARQTLSEWAHFCLCRGCRRVKIKMQNQICSCVCVYFSHPGEAVVWQSGPSANSQRAAGCRASSSARWAAQEPLCQNVLPSWPQVCRPPLHTESFRWVRTTEQPLTRKRKFITFPVWKTKQTLRLLTSQQVSGFNACYHLLSVISSHKIQIGRNPVQTGKQQTQLAVIYLITG